MYQVAGQRAGRRGHLLLIQPAANLKTAFPIAKIDQNVNKMSCLVSTSRICRARVPGAVGVDVIFPNAVAHKPPAVHVYFLPAEAGYVYIPQLGLRLTLLSSSRYRPRMALRL